MSTVNQSGARVTDMQGLVGLYGQMQEGDVLRGTPRNLYASSQENEPTSPDKVGFCRASSYGDAKARVRNVVAKQVGGERADKIMRDVLKHNPRLDGTGNFLKPNHTAMTRAQLRGVIERTCDEMVQVGAVSPSDRGHVLEELNRTDLLDPAAFMQDKATNKLIHQFATADDSAEDPQFLDAVHELEKTIDKSTLRSNAKSGNYKNKTMEQADEEFQQKTEVPRDIAAQARKLRDQFLANSARRQVKMPDKERAKFCDAEFSKMTLAELKGHLAPVKAVVAQRVKQGVGKQLEAKLRTDPTKDGKIITNGGWDYDENKAHPVNSREKLETIRDALSSDQDHLRVQSGFVYTKRDHPGITKAKWFNKNPFRSTRADANQVANGRSTVLMLLKGSLVQAGADRDSARKLAISIISPYYRSASALHRGDLCRIISRVDEYSNLHNEVKARRLNGGADALKFDNCLQNESEDGKLFSRYLALSGETQTLHEWESRDTLLKHLEEIQPTLDGRRRNDRMSRKEFHEVYEKAKVHAQDLYKQYKGQVHEFDSEHGLYYELLSKFTDHPSKFDKKDMNALMECVRQDRNQRTEQLHNNCYQSFLKDCDTTPAAGHMQA